MENFGCRASGILKKCFVTISLAFVCGRDLQKPLREEGSAWRGRGNRRAGKTTDEPGSIPDFARQTIYSNVASET